jgi:hypothetical protein
MRDGRNDNAPPAAGAYAGCMTVIPLSRLERLQLSLPPKPEPSGGGHDAAGSGAGAGFLTGALRFGAAFFFATFRRAAGFAVFAVFFVLFLRAGAALRFAVFFFAFRFFAMMVLPIHFISNGISPARNSGCRTIQSH